jgi:hypothetical protein
MKTASTCPGSSGKEMGKGRDKRRRKVKTQDERTRDEVERAYAEAERHFRSGDPPIPDAPDAPVDPPLKSRPRAGSGAIAIPKPEFEDASVDLKEKTTSR